MSGIEVKEGVVAVCRHHIPWYGYGPERIPTRARVNHAKPFLQCITLGYEDFGALEMGSTPSPLLLLLFELTVSVSM